MFTFTFIFTFTRAPSSLIWDLTLFPEWVCSLKEGANAYQPIAQGSVMDGAAAVHACNPNPARVT